MREGEAEKAKESNEIPGASVLIVDGLNDEPLPMNRDRAVSKFRAIESTPP